MKKETVKKLAQSNNKRKAHSKKGGKRADRTKLKRETAFLYFLAFNKHTNQTKKFLSSLLLPSQYTVLREIAVNELAGHLPSRGKLKRKSELKKEARKRLTKLAKGELLKSNLHHILDLIQILADNTLTYHDLC